MPRSKRLKYDPSAVPQQVRRISSTLVQQLGETTSFKGSKTVPITHVYNPLSYAAASFGAYVDRYTAHKPPLLLIGMNPGPFGMAQTGVPFGDVTMVRDFLGINQQIVTDGTQQHTKRPIQGFECPRSEVSGTRLWGFMQRRFRDADHMSKNLFVYNYCPFAFMTTSGANVTLDKIKGKEHDRITVPCDAALLDLIAILEPKLVVAIGTYAAKRIAALDLPSSIPTAILQHPSPASPTGRIWSTATSLNQLTLPKSPVKDLEAFLT